MNQQAGFQQQTNQTQARALGKSIRKAVSHPLLAEAPKPRGPASLLWEGVGSWECRGKAESYGKKPQDSGTPRLISISSDANSQLQERWPHRAEALEYDTS